MSACVCGFKGSVWFIGVAWVGHGVGALARAEGARRDVFLTRWELIPKQNVQKSSTHIPEI